MNLRWHFFLINLVIITFAFLITFAVFFFIANKTVKGWGLDLAEKQLLYDKTRAVQFLTREITLSRQLAQSQTILQWARNQNDGAAEKAALEEMEKFRSMFGDGNYFIAFKESGKYFYNNATGKYDNNQYRYTLSPDKEHDSWFYGIIAENKDFHINVNPDVYLGETMLWVDVLIRDRGVVLGVMGTGLELNGFIEKFADAPVTGISSLFIDHNGAVQVYFDKNYIDFSSITKSGGQHKLIDDMFREAGDAQYVREAMKQLPLMAVDAVLSRFVEVNDKKYLAGITFIPELNWYEIALFDPEKLIRSQDLYGILVAFIATLLVSMLFYNFSMKRFVLNPLQRLENAIFRMREGDYGAIEKIEAQDGDVGRLLLHFQMMARSVREHQDILEKTVQERTGELNRLVKMDAMTEVLNRRGMKEALEKELSRAMRNGDSVGILWVDIDRFKAINDSYGHGVGDAVIVAVARGIMAAVRQYDHVARWGGDEFIVLLPQCSRDILEGSGERIRTTLQGQAIWTPTVELKVQVSVGGYLAQAGESVETMLNKADKALYQAKESGRNAMRIFS